MSAMTRDDIIRLALEHFGAVLKPSDLEVKLAVLAVTAEREACAEVCEEKQTYSMPISCPDGISGCCVNHVIPARREKTGTECAAAIRARGET
jgi:hypothetical protein